MEKRQITIHDGRYLIFYTFDDEPAPSAAENEDGEAARRQPEVEPEAEEERGV